LKRKKEAEALLARAKKEMLELEEKIKQEKLLKQKEEEILKKKQQQIKNEQLKNIQSGPSTEIKLVKLDHSIVQSKSLSRNDKVNISLDRGDTIKDNRDII
jgi:hypothetical protein